MREWLAFWAEINTPSDFKSDPYGELTNQLSHTFLGVIFACIVALVYLVFSGDFPAKEAVAFVVTLPYIAGEILAQRWRGWDTIADVFFYAIGGYGVLSSLTERQFCGEAFLQPQPVAFGVCFGLFCSVLFLRLQVRVKQKYS